MPHHARAKECHHILAPKSAAAAAAATAAALGDGPRAVEPVGQAKPKPKPTLPHFAG